MIENSCNSLKKIHTNIQHNPTISLTRLSSSKMFDLKKNIISPLQNVNNIFSHRSKVSTNRPLSVGVDLEVGVDLRVDLGFDLGVNPGVDLGVDPGVDLKVNFKVDFDLD